MMILIIYVQMHDDGGFETFIMSINTDEYLIYPNYNQSIHNFNLHLQKNYLIVKIIINQNFIS
jgi:hypothetical protein